MQNLCLNFSSFLWARAFECNVKGLIYIHYIYIVYQHFTYYENLMQEIEYIVDLCQI